MSAAVILNTRLRRYVMELDALRLCALVERRDTDAIFSEYWTDVAQDINLAKEILERALVKSRRMTMQQDGKEKYRDLIKAIDGEAPDVLGEP